MIPKKEITIYDIAKALNISPATVSRGLKDHPAINIKTRKRIMDMSLEMGYRSNHFASNLRKQKTHTIGILVHELNSHFISSVLAGIEKVTAGSGYDLIIGHSSETYRKEVSNAHNLFHKRVDGLIASLAFDTRDLAHFDPFVNKGIPVVFFDRVENTSYGTRVVIDNAKAGFEATTHLAAQGCRNIAHITANLTRNVYADRLKGYRQALEYYGLPYDPSRVLVNDLSEEAAMRAAREIINMDPRPDGVFITNDFCAAVFMQALKESGVSVPEDIAIVGFNNDVIAKLIHPKLTTIDYRGEDMGEKAATSLLEQLSGSVYPPTNPAYLHTGTSKTIVIPSELVIRGSSMRRPLS
ncbi:MAG: LacI family DNA-binding transcriptional regulator [Puia sp.]|nr:LacI family DNA-binding transcriptional regulator [Puia sp.]